MEIKQTDTHTQNSICCLPQAQTTKDEKEKRRETQKEKKMFFSSIQIDN